jgi:DNA-binding GntR family transcriptional regulator
MSSLGIVELRRNQGAFVTALSSARLIGMLEVLAELKVLAAKQSARRMTLQERQRLTSLCDEMTRSAEKQELQKYFDLATELHEVICEGTHNSFLLDTTRNVQICLCAYRRHLSRILHMPIQTSLKENRSIVDAIVTGDAAAAEKWMRQQTELRREEFGDLVTLVHEKSQTADGSA